MPAGSSRSRGRRRRSPSTARNSTRCWVWRRRASANSSRSKRTPSPDSPCMPVDAALAALASHVGGFHITDRTMKRAQEEVAAAIASGDVDDRTRDAYLNAVRHYFDGFQKEARAHLR